MVIDIFKVQAALKAYLFMLPAAFYDRINTPEITLVEGKKVVFSKEDIQVMGLQLVPFKRLCIDAVDYHIEIFAVVVYLRVGDCCQAVLHCQGMDFKDICEDAGLFVSGVMEVYPCNAVLIRKQLRKPLNHGFL